MRDGREIGLLTSSEPLDSAGPETPSFYSVPSPPPSLISSPFLVSSLPFLLLKPV